MEFLKSSRYALICTFTAMVLLCPGLNTAQNPAIDSLKLLLVQSVDDTTRSNLLEQLSDIAPPGEWQRFNLQLKKLAISRLRSANSLAAKRFFLDKYITALNNEGYDAVSQGKLDTAYARFTACLQIDAVLQSLPDLIVDYNNLGYYHQIKGDIPHALAYYQRALALDERLGNVEGSAYSLINIAGLHADHGDQALAFRGYRECLSKFQSIAHLEGSGIALNSIARLFIEEQQWDSAHHYLQLAMLTVDTTVTSEVLSAIYHYNGYILFQEGQFTAALRSYDRSLKMAQEGEWAEAQASVYLEMSQIYRAENQLNTSLLQARKGLELAKESGVLQVVQDAAIELEKIYRARKEYALALEMKDLSTSINDSLRNNANRKALMFTQMQYEFDKKAVSDSLLGANELEIIGVKLDRRTSQQRYLFGMLALMLIFLAVIYQRFSVTRRQKRQIEMANVSLERQHLLNQKIFSVISHDFRGPMISLDLMLQSLSRRTGEPLLQEFIGHAGAEISSANAILNNLLNWARSEISIDDWDGKATPLPHVVSEIIEEFAGKLTGKQIRLQLRIPQTATIVLPADILRIALRNLLSNAIKFSYAGSEILLAYSPVDGALQVHDDGVGIPQAILEQLFLQEVDTLPGTSQEEGFGMGLYIVAELLHKYHYEIAAVSTSVGGTTFTIRPQIF